MPFGDYKDFEDCVKQNQDKANPEAYCGEIKQRTEKECLCNSIRVLKSDDGEFLIYGPASVEVVDREGDKIRADALSLSLKQLLRRGRLSLAHEDIIVGEILPEREIGGKIYKTEVINKRLMVLGNVWDDTRASRDTREKINRGVYKSYSISGEALESQRICDGSGCYRDIAKLDSHAVTICEKGMNQLANFDVLQKSNNVDCTFVYFENIQKEYDPNQPRADDGKWTDGGGSSDAGKKKIQFEYNSDSVADVKKIPGAKWNPDEKVWEIPASSEKELDEFKQKYKVTDGKLGEPTKIKTIVNVRGNKITFSEAGKELERALNNQKEFIAAHGKPSATFQRVIEEYSAAMKRAIGITKTDGAIEYITIATPNFPVNVKASKTEAEVHKLTDETPKPPAVEAKKEAEPGAAPPAGAGTGGLEAKIDRLCQMMEQMMGGMGKAQAQPPAETQKAADPTTTAGQATITPPANTGPAPVTKADVELWVKESIAKLASTEPAGTTPRPAIKKQNEIAGGKIAEILKSPSKLDELSVADIREIQGA